MGGTSDITILCRQLTICMMLGVRLHRKNRYLQMELVQESRFDMH